MSNSKEFSILPYEQAIEILSRYGIPIVEGGVARSCKEAIEIAKRLGYPVTLKVLSPQIVHKTEAKVLRLDVKTEPELIKAYDEVTKNAKEYDPKAEIHGVLVQKMLYNGVEVIIGISKDPQFGPVILFGLGGIFVEVLKDVSLRVPPLTRFDAEEMIRETKGYRLLEGFRGKPKFDLEAIVNILLRVSNMSIDLRESILGMDLNPVIVHEEGKGASVVDVRIIKSKDIGQLPVKSTRK
jgi:acyl-CoA synthetase (NDP forming)